MIRPADTAAVNQAAALLRAGQLVAFPTETVYGLGADASQPLAVARIFAAKGRPADHPLIVHLADLSALPNWAAQTPGDAQKLAERFWPGPLTLILQKRPEVPAAVSGGQNSVGLRVPSHPVALALLEAFGGGIAAPSANRFGRISPTTAAHVAQEFPDGLPLILDGGPCQVGIESTIVDFTSGRAVLLRPGGIALDALAAVLGYRPGAPTHASPRASGTLAQHYAPHTPTDLVQSSALDARAAELSASLAVLARREAPAHFSGLWLRAPEGAEAYAAQLYAALRLMDAAGVARILVEAPPHGPEWAAVNDRLRRASSR